ncbi:MAG: hypothetical protein ABR583_01880 [Gaiellaceae bacterium]
MTEAASARRDERGRPLPPPLAPAERTVGQLVAESIRLYGGRFWAVLPLGLSVALLDQLLRGREQWLWLVAMLTVGALALTASYTAACLLVLRMRPSPGRIALAYAIGVLAFLPFPLLMLGFVLPGVAWLALVGLAVPVALAEPLGLRGSFRRAVALARADYVHALGSLATLVIVYFLTRTVLVLLLRGQGEQTERIAFFLADLVLSPLVFLGSALLYVDQAARLDSADPRR